MTRFPRCSPDDEFKEHAANTTTEEIADMEI
jgi:hypothetical protein